MFWLFAAFLSAAPATAQVFQYTDKDGRSHFVDSAEKIPEEYRHAAGAGKELAPISRIKPAREKLYEKEHYAAVPSGGKARVELFVTDWCPYCKSLEEYLKKEGIRYTRYNVDNDAQGQQLVARLGGGVPVTRIGGTIIQGYQPEAIKAALKKK